MAAGGILQVERRASVNGAFYTKRIRHQDGVSLHLNPLGNVANGGLQSKCIWPDQHSGMSALFGMDGSSVASAVGVAAAADLPVRETHKVAAPYRAALPIIFQMVVLSFGHGARFAAPF
jgi:hypothetical protein